MPDALETLRGWRAENAIILGSGLSGIVEPRSPQEQLAYENFPQLPAPKVSGHRGQFALGEFNKTRVIFAQGRVHLYEGHSASAVTAGVRLLAECGIKHLILTNAAGCLNPAFKPGAWMMISDHLNLTGTSPLLGSAQFVDLSEVYSNALRAKFRAAAGCIGMTLHEGVYASVLGPQYETPAEVRMYRSFGADAVGMSTVLEAIQARALGLEVSGFSCLTNWAAGLNAEALSHSDVLAVGKNAAAEFSRLLAAAL